MKLKQIAKEFDIKVINVTQNSLDKYCKKYGMPPENFMNNAYVIGDDEIILGIYDDNEVRIASFFHEIGHTLVSESFEKMVNYDTMLIEYQAWIEGLKLAKQYEYTFSRKVFKYIIKCLNSFYKDSLSAYNTSSNEKADNN